MQRSTLYRIAFLAAGFLAAWLFFRYLLPIFLPFGIGFLLALSAEPAVGLLVRMKLPRWAATGLGVSLTLILLIALIWVVGAIFVKELSVLAGKLPDLQSTAQQTTQHLRTLLESTAQRAPDGIRPLIDRSVDRLFSSGNTLLEQATIRLPSAITAFLGRIPNGALSIGTGVISGFMLSSRMPKIRLLLRQKMPDKIKNQLLPALKRTKNALLGWLKAQLKLCGITLVVVLAGFLLLRIPLAPLWAAVVAVVDAVPLLGTGTILIPWAVVCLFQRQHLRSVGLLCIYVCALITRTVLEPRLVGRHLGLDPLVTLVFLYLGYRFWGILGMLFSPMLAAALTAAGQDSWKSVTKE